MHCDIEQCVDAIKPAFRTADAEYNDARFDQTSYGTKLTLSTVGAKAFAGVSPQAVITVPAGKKSEYKKLLLERGVTKNMTVK